MALACVAMLRLTASRLLTADASADEILSLPGWDAPLPSKQFSGYLNVSSTKHMHYWYIESEGVDPSDSKTPIVLWLNGGPGCSSLDGLFYEWGPFRVNATTSPPSLYRNAHTISKIANVFYLESPVGVGYSYSSASSPTKKIEDYHCTDDTTAQENLKAVELFFQRFPELVTHPFFITGESYGGVYVPTLAEAIVLASGNKTYKGARLHGIAVGNGCSGSEIGVCGGERDHYGTEYLINQAFVPQSLKDNIRRKCDFSEEISNECESLISEMHKTIGHINLYNVYGDCFSGTETMLKAPLGETKFFNIDKIGGPDACIDSRIVSDYLNQESVVKAAHLHPIAFTWKTCATARGWTYRSTRPNLPRDTYPLLIEKLDRVVIYNGDWDACVPYTDGEAWTSGMKIPVETPWHPWTYSSPDGPSKQVGGYATRYKSNFSFVTVRGGRHEVPETAPLKAYELMRHVFQGEVF